VRKYGVTEGEFITQEEMLGQASLLLLVPEVADKLFGRR